MADRDLITSILFCEVPRVHGAGIAYMYLLVISWDDIVTVVSRNMMGTFLSQR